MTTVQKMLDGLAFLPLHEVNDGMTYLKEHVPNDPAGARDLLTYFDQTYVTGTVEHFEI